MKRKAFASVLMSLILLSGCSTGNLSSADSSATVSSVAKDPCMITEQEYADFLQLCQEKTYTAKNIEDYQYNDKGEKGYIAGPDDLISFMFDVPQQRFGRIYRGCYTVAFPNPRSIDDTDGYIDVGRMVGSSSWGGSITDHPYNYYIDIFPEYQDLIYDSDKKAYYESYVYKEREFFTYYYFEDGIMTEMDIDEYVGGEYPYAHGRRIITDIGTTVLEIPDDDYLNALYKRYYGE